MLLPPLAVLAALAIAPAAAHAQQPPAPPAPAPAPAPAAPAPAPAPAPAVTPSLHVVTEKVNGAHAAIVTRTRFRVRVIVKPYVAGQQVTITFARAGKAVKTATATVRPGRTAGQALVGYAPRSAGRLVVQAVHAATPQLPALASQKLKVDVLPRSASTRSAVRTLQTRLSALGYVVGARGHLDARTQRAVLAFRKVTGMARTSAADVSVFRALARGAGAFAVRHRDHGRHVEADLSRQVIALIGAGGKVERIYPISSGKPSTPTILGSFRVYMRDPGTNSEGMVASSYFIRGYAIHGYADVPVFNASHGCLRLPIPDAYTVYGWIRLGTVVDVYP